MKSPMTVWMTPQWTVDESLSEANFLMLKAQDSMMWHERLFDWLAKSMGVERSDT